MQYVYLNGQYARMSDAKVSINDRGYQFGDGIYEVICIYQGKAIDFQAHVQRLYMSLESLSIRIPCSIPALQVIANEVYRRNHVTNGLLYLQVTRGVAPRNHLFPTPALKPSLLVTITPKDVLQKGRRVCVLTTKDPRSSLASHKSISALPNILEKQMAKEKGADEVILIGPGGEVREGGSSNLFLIKNNVFYTPSLAPHIVPGITRQRLIQLIKEKGWSLKETTISVEDLHKASEVFLSHSSNGISHVESINGIKLPTQGLQSKAEALFDAYMDFVYQTPISSSSLGKAG